MADDTEKRTAEWIASKDWKGYKTVSNRDDFNEEDNSDDIKEFNQVSVSKLVDDKFHPNISVWKVEAYIPEPDSKAIMRYYNIPTLRSKFDTDSMSTFYGIPISDESKSDSQNKKDVEQKDDLKTDPVDQHSDSAVDIPMNSELPDPNGLCLSVVKTIAAAKGFISPRIFMNIVNVKYNEMTQEHYTVGTYIPDEMLDEEMKEILQVSDDDLTNLVIGRNLSLRLSAKRMENTGYSKVVYVLQANNGGWIPQWTVEIGMVDQHMIAICKRMTQWILLQRDAQFSAENEESATNDTSVVPEAE